MKNTKTLKTLGLAMVLSISLTACGSSGSSNSGSYSGLDGGISPDYASASSSSNSGLNMDSLNYNISPDYVDKSAGASVNSYEEDYYYEETSSNKNNNSTQTFEADIQVYDVKLVYHSSVEIETKEYDEAYRALKELITKYNGIIEEEQFYNNNGSYLHTYNYRSNQVQRELDILVRIPTDNFDAFNAENEANGNVISKTSNVQNITQKYYDTTASLEGLQIQLSRLQEIMRYTTEVEDLITLNREISNLEQQINNMTTQIRTMDMDVAYSYVYINLKEVVEYSEEPTPVKKNTFFDRLKNTLTDTWDDLLTFLENLLFLAIRLLPYIVIIGIIIIIVRVIYKKRKAIRKEKGKPSLMDLHRMIQNEVVQEQNQNIQVEQTSNTDNDNNNGESK